MKFRVRKRWLFLGLVMLFATGYLLLSDRFVHNEEDAYQQLLKRANPSSLLESHPSYQAKQYRQGVQKSFWYEKGDQRLEFLLTSADAELVYEKQGNSQEIVEHMHDVRCLLQEEIYYLPRDPHPMQTVRCFEADSAEYHYTSNRLIADHAKMTLFTLPGNELILPMDDDVPTMSCYADSVEVAFVEGKFVPDIVTLVGNVRLINREGSLMQYILADKVVLTCSTYEMHFFATGKYRVLFYDKANNLQMSATELIMKRDKTTKKESMQGIGDVRFRFIGQEFDQIRKRFLLDKKGL